MADDLPKIDRWHSEPLDVHTWSDHPEIKVLCDELYDAAGISTLVSKGKGNRKPKRTVKESLRVLILDLYVKWLKDPSLSIGFSKTKSSYKVGSRYNGLYIPEKIIEVEALLVDAGYVEELTEVETGEEVFVSDAAEFEARYELTPTIISRAANPNQQQRYVTVDDTKFMARYAD